MDDSLYATGIRPIIDQYLEKQASERRDYGDYWSASSAGYCYRKVIFDRLQVPYVTPEPRLQRVFTAGKIFHELIQKLTKEAKVSIAQELELKDEELKIIGHFDDLVLLDGRGDGSIVVNGTNQTPGGKPLVEDGDDPTGSEDKQNPSRLILYDYKTVHSGAFKYQQDRPMSYYHTMQLGTYMYMLRSNKLGIKHNDKEYRGMNLKEARILKISKDDMRMSEEVLYWTETLEQDIKSYWTRLNDYWEAYVERGALPNCTCAEIDGGWFGKPTAKGKIYCPYAYMGEPCSLEWFTMNKDKIKEPV